VASVCQDCGKDIYPDKVTMDPNTLLMVCPACLEELDYSVDSDD
jgi:hypothetical protein